MTGPTPTTTIKATVDQAEVLRQFALDMSARVGRRLSLGTAINIAVTVANEHQDEAVKIARTREGDE